MCNTVCFTHPASVCNRSTRTITQRRRTEIYTRRSPAQNQRETTTSSQTSGDVSFSGWCHRRDPVRSMEPRLKPFLNISLVMFSLQPPGRVSHSRRALQETPTRRGFEPSWWSSWWSGPRCSLSRRKDTSEVVWSIINRITNISSINDSATTTNTTVLLPCR